MFFLFFGITSCTSTSKKGLKYENGTIDVINLKLYQKENIIRLSEIADSQNVFRISKQPKITRNIQA